MIRAPKSRQRGFMLDPYRFGVAAPLPLDAYTTDLWGAYSLDKLLSAYAGPCVRVRRSSDDAEQDIGFSAGVIDSAALLAFAGAGDALIRTWYDQSGGGKHLTQTVSSSRQPKIVDQGVFIPEVEWDGVNDSLTSPASGTPTGVTVYLAGRDRVVGDRMLMHWTGQTQIATTTVGGTPYRLRALIAGAQTVDYESAMARDNTTFAYVFDRTQATLATEHAAYVNGVQLTAAASSGSTVTGAFSSAVWHIGSDSSSANCSRLSARSLLIYEAAHSSGTVAAISAIVQPPALVDGLAGYTSGLWAALGFKRAVPGYAGAALRVRRSSDNTEQDFNFLASGLLDVASILTFVGAGNGFVVKWYDQSGNGNHLANATAANQPVIVNGGAAYAAVTFGNFGGTDRNMVSDNNTGTPSAFTIFFAGRLNATAENVLEQTVNVNSNTGAVFYKSAARSLHAGHTLTSQTNRAESEFNIGSIYQAVAIRLDRTQATKADQVALFTGGFKHTRVGNRDQGTTPSGNFTAAKWYFGGRAGALTFTTDATMLVIYEAAKTDAEVASISRRLC
jgi:hypothetical protein